MKRFITFSTEFFGHRLRTLILVGLVSLMSGLMVAHQPAYAANSTTANESALTAPPAPTYEEALEVIDDPNGVQKQYEENLKQYRQENPEQGGLVKEAKELVDKITPGKPKSAKQ